MITCDGPRVIEFNARFGDPEAQVVIPMIDGPLAPVLAAAADGRLAGERVGLRPEPHVGVVVASRGYPASSQSDVPIAGVDAAAMLEDVIVFHAGTSVDPSGRLVTAGGRVLTVVGRGRTYEAAIERAYAGVARVAFDGMQYRRDIGRKALGNAKNAKNSKNAKNEFSI
jgi:phosphoribosylamine--glycine ligase